MSSQAPDSQSARYAPALLQGRADRVSHSRRRGSYRKLFKLGDGGTAEVYLAIEQSLGKLVALKILRRELAEDPDLVEMFLTEARIAAQLSHPNIVRIHEVFIRRDVPVIVMEHLEGLALSRVLERTLATVPLVMHLRVIADALRGLHHAHEFVDLRAKQRRLVHRDVSPHNIIVTHDGQVKVVDFGLAKLAGAASQTPVGVFKGKLTYASPEQVQGRANIDHRTDIYAVGVMLWEAMARRRLFAGLAPPDIITRTLAGQIPPPCDASAECPPLLKAACKRAMALRRSARYDSAGEMCDVLETAILELGGSPGRADLGQFMVGEFGDIIERTGRSLRSALTARPALNYASGAIVSFPPKIKPGSLRSVATKRRSRRARNERPWRTALVGVGLIVATLVLAAWWVSRAPAKPIVRGPWVQAAEG